MFRAIFPILVLILVNHSASSQSLDRVKTTIDTLCSPTMKGRGAAFDGQQKAAQYISAQFKSIGLDSLSSNFFQRFSYSINTFPNRVQIKLHDKSLMPGSDFIISPNCPSVKKTYQIIYIDSNFINLDKRIEKFSEKNIKKYAIVISSYFNTHTLPDYIQLKLKQAGCVVYLENKKLTMGLSSKISSMPIVFMKEACYSKNDKRISLVIDSKLISNYEAQNIVGVIKGKIKPDSFIFVTAHYDHLGTLGETVYFPGANDNSSGVSMLLEFANYFKKNPPKYSIAFIAFGAEEAGLIGSKFFTENPLISLKSIRFLINLDLMGTGDDGMMVVNGTEFTKEFQLLESINQSKNYLPAIKKRGKAANSDHYHFVEKGVPGFFFYTLGGISAYHDIYDIPSTLPLTKYSEVYQLIIDFIHQLSD